MNSKKLFFRTKRILLTVIAYSIAVGFIVMTCQFFSGLKKEEFYTLNAEIKRTDELKVGGLVRMSGLDIGTVSDLVLLPNFSVRVVMHIDNKYQIPDDSTVAIYTDGLLGAKYISVLPGGSMDNMNDGDEFEYAQDSVNLTEMLVLGINQFKANSEEADKCLENMTKKKAQK